MPPSVKWIISVYSHSGIIYIIENEQTCSWRQNMDELHKHNAEQKKFQSRWNWTEYLGICTLTWYKYKEKQRRDFHASWGSGLLWWGKNGASEEMQCFCFFIRLYDIYLNLLNLSFLFIEPQSMELTSNFLLLHFSHPTLEKMETRKKGWHSYQH